MFERSHLASAPVSSHPQKPHQKSLNAPIRESLADLRFLHEKPILYETHKSTIGVQAGVLKDSTINQTFNIFENKTISGNVYYYPDSRRILSSRFTGRADVLGKLEECLLPSVSEDETSTLERKVFVIHGFGGSGKTQVCIKFAELHRQKFWGVFWVDASSNESCIRSFARIAEIGGVNKGSNVEENSTYAREWLCNIQKDWLLIVDNADDHNLKVTKFFPTGDIGSILVTTRNKDVRISATSKDMSWELKGMGITNGVDLLLKTCEREISDKLYRSQAEPIVETLGCLPLAIIQAGAAIRNGLQLSEYLEEFKRNSIQLLSLAPTQGADTYDYTVYGTCQVSRELIENQGSEISSDALELLETSSFLHFEDIPEHIFQKIPDGRDLSYLRKTMDFLCSLLIIPSGFRETSFFLEIPASECRKDRVGQALNLLTSYSLISHDRERNLFSMHRLVHSWTRSRLKGQSRRWATYLASVALTSSIGTEQDTYHFEFRRRLYPHVKFHLEETNSMSSITRMSKAEIASQYAQVLSENGYYIMAEDLYHRSLLCKERLSSAGDRKTLKTANDLASVLERLGRYTDAADMSTKTLAECRKCLGEDDPETLESLGTLAMALQGDGKYLLAKEATEQLLEKRRRVLGDEDRATIKTISNLALLLERELKYPEAIQMSRESLSLRERLLGQDHRDTLESLSDLVLILERQGADYDAVERMGREAFERRENALGKDHPDTLTSLSRLVSILEKRGNYEEAETAARQVLYGRRKILGPDHPDTSKIFNNLAGILMTCNNYSGAEDLYRKALAGLKISLVEQHPYTLMVETNLAMVLKRQRRYPEAEATYRKILSIYKKNSDLERPEALACLSNLAMLLRSSGNLSEAEHLGRHALDLYKKVLPEPHLRTLASLDNLAWILAKAEKYAEAEAMSRQALDGFKQIVGPDNPDTLVTGSHLAYILHRQSRYVEAWFLYHRACEGYKMLGVNPNSQWCFQYFCSLKKDMESNGITEPLLSEGCPVTSQLGDIPLANFTVYPQPALKREPSKTDQVLEKKRRRTPDQEEVGGPISKKLRSGDR